MKLKDVKKTVGKNAGKYVIKTWQNVSRQCVLLYLSSAQNAGSSEKYETILI